ncbi:hypothetical protein A9320_01310 [Ruegeria sp. PBVC088]|nr:hypothetical protein A9320_01310 [Ruegeria sp. PBVC088]
MGQDTVHVMLEGRCHGTHRQPLFDSAQHLEVVAGINIGFTRQQKLHAVHLRPAHAQRDVQPAASYRHGVLAW